MNATGSFRIKKKSANDDRSIPNSKSRNEDIEQILENKKKKNKKSLQGGIGHQKFLQKKIILSNGQAQIHNQSVNHPTSALASTQMQNDDLFEPSFQTAVENSRINLFSEQGPRTTKASLIDETNLGIKKPNKAKDIANNANMNKPLFGANHQRPGEDKGMAELIQLDIKLGQNSQKQSLRIIPPDKNLPKDSIQVGEGITPITMQISTKYELSDDTTPDTTSLPKVLSPLPQTIPSSNVSRAANRLSPLYNIQITDESKVQKTGHNYPFTTQTYTKANTNRAQLVSQGFQNTNNNESIFGLDLNSSQNMFSHPTRSTLGIQSTKMQHIQNMQMDSIQEAQIVNNRLRPLRELHNKKKPSDKRRLNYRLQNKPIQISVPSKMRNNSVDSEGEASLLEESLCSMIDYYPQKTETNINMRSPHSKGDIWSSKLDAPHQTQILSPQLVNPISQRFDSLSKQRVVNHHKRSLRGQNLVSVTDMFQQQQMHQLDAIEPFNSVLNFDTHNQMAKTKPYKLFGQGVPRGPYEPQPTLQDKIQASRERSNEFDFNSPRGTAAGIFQQRKQSQGTSVAHQKYMKTVDQNKIGFNARGNLKGRRVSVPVQQKSRPLLCQGERKEQTTLLQAYSNIGMRGYISSLENEQQQVLNQMILDQNGHVLQQKDGEEVFSQGSDDAVSFNSSQLAFKGGSTFNTSFRNDKHIIPQATKFSTLKPNQFTQFNPPNSAPGSDSPIHYTMATSPSPVKSNHSRDIKTPASSNPGTLYAMHQMESFRSQGQAALKTPSSSKRKPIPLNQFEGALTILPIKQAQPLPYKRQVIKPHHLELVCESGRPDSHDAGSTYDNSTVKSPKSKLMIQTDDRSSQQTVSLKEKQDSISYAGDRMNLTSAPTVTKNARPKIKQIVLQNGGQYGIKNKPLIINKQIDTTGSKRKQVGRIGSTIQALRRSNEDIDFELQQQTQHTVERQNTDISEERYTSFQIKEMKDISTREVMKKRL